MGKEGGKGKQPLRGALLNQYYPGQQELNPGSQCRMFASELSHPAREEFGHLYTDPCWSVVMEASEGP